MHNFIHFTGYFCLLRQNNVGNGLQSSKVTVFPSDNLGDILQNSLQIIRVILMVETTELSSQNPPLPCDRDRWFACILAGLRCYSKLLNRPQKSDFSLQFLVFLSLSARLLSESLHIQLNFLSFFLNLNIIKMIRTNKQLGLSSHFD